MLKFDLLKNAGIQSEKTTKEPSLDHPIDTVPKISTKKNLAKKSKVSRENKKRLKAVEAELNSTQKSVEKKKTNLWKPVLLILLFAALGTGGYYIYTNPSLLDIAKNRVSEILQSKKTPSIQEATIVKKAPPEIKEIPVSKEISSMIQKNSMNLPLITGMMELIPSDAIIYDFYAKNNNLSLICIVNDIISGENLKFYANNHKMDMKSELFYIEKTENNKKYQITGLVNLLNNSKTDSEYVYQNDRALYYNLNSIAQSYGITIKPLTISKRDQTQIRDAHIVLSGSLNQMISFLRKLSIEQLNIVVKAFEFVNLDNHNSVNDLELKIDLTIYPQH